MVCDREGINVYSIDIYVQSRKEDDRLLLLPHVVGFSWEKSVIMPRESQTSVKILFVSNTK